MLLRNGEQAQSALDLGLGLMVKWFQKSVAVKVNCLVKAKGVLSAQHKQGFPLTREAAG